MDILKKITAYGLLFLSAFAVTLVLTFPVEAIVKEYVFPRLEKRTGARVEAASIDYAFPAGVELAGVRVSTGTTSTARQFIFERIVIRPSLSSLFGDAEGSFEISLAGGTLAGRLADGNLDLLAEGLSLEELNPIDSRKLGEMTGRVSFSGVVPIRKADRTVPGKLGLTVEDVRIGSVSIFGVDITELEMSTVSMNILVGPDKVEFLEGSSSGGNIDLEFGGAVFLASPIKSSGVDILLSVKLPPEVLESMGEQGKLLRMAQQTQGRVQLALTGSLGSLNFEPR